jgi:hypothetical protein
MGVGEAGCRMSSERERAYQREYHRKKRAEDAVYRAKQAAISAAGHKRERERKRVALEERIARLRDQGYVTVSEACDLLGGSADAFAWARRAGHLTSLRIEGVCVYAVAEVEHYLAEHRGKRGTASPDFPKETHREMVRKAIVARGGTPLDGMTEEQIRERRRQQNNAYYRKRYRDDAAFREKERQRHRTRTARRKAGAA